MIELMGRLACRKDRKRNKFSEMKEKEDREEEKNRGQVDFSSWNDLEDDSKEDMANCDHFSKTVDNMGGEEGVDLLEVEGADDGSYNHDDETMPDLECVQLKCQEIISVSKGKVFKFIQGYGATCCALRSPREWLSHGYGAVGVLRPILENAQFQVIPPIRPESVTTPNP
ncbi:Prostaglandin E synthase 3 [Fukomys damarensis]|uniref:Prostaglandin E synthase 3 n=1 Tax=Fukomys damarensis TaxID=885580 RepID=A0A091CZT6_FUKDA|nr:Prostaglandin E synthase 3 [Fukomys damarensis]